MNINFSFTPEEFKKVLSESPTLRLLTGQNVVSTGPTYTRDQYNGESDPAIALNKLKQMLGGEQDYHLFSFLPAIKYWRDCSIEVRHAIFALYPQYTIRDSYRNDSPEKRGLANSKHFMEYLRDCFLNRI